MNIKMDSIRQDIMARIEGLDYEGLMEPLQELKRCSICPRQCKADRFSNNPGYCKAGPSFSISSICIHRGEEPAISGSQGICNIFFTNCNLQCTYCQNHQISDNSLDYSGQKMDLQQVLYEIQKILSAGINIVGFVSPSHFIPQVKIIIVALRELGLDPVFVYNTNGYDRAGVIRGMEPFIDVYLPDYKYADPVLSKDYSDAGNYPEIALAALQEMFRQTGPGMIQDTEGYAQKGLIIRHLVLPGHPQNSIQVLRNIAAHLSADLHISLMSQYYPTYRVRGHASLGRVLERDEYYMVVDEMERLGFNYGWVQELSSHDHYRPDFIKDHPFE